MPYAKRTKKSYGNRKYRSNNNSLAKKAYRLAKKAYKLPELKYIQPAAAVTPTSVSGTGSILSVAQCIQGTTNNARIGDTIKPTSLRLRVSMKLGAAATDTLIRMIVFRWISEAPANLSEVLGTTPTVLSFKGDDLRFQSEIMYDQTFRLSTAEKTEMFLSKTIKVKKYISYPEASTSANRNDIYIGWVSDEAVNTPSISYISRLFYRDS